MKVRLIGGVHRLIVYFSALIFVACESGYEKPSIVDWYSYYTDDVGSIIAVVNVFSEEFNYSTWTNETRDPLVNPMYMDSFNFSLSTKKGGGVSIFILSFVKSEELGDFSVSYFESNFLSTSQMKEQRKKFNELLNEKGIRVRGI